MLVLAVVKWGYRLAVDPRSIDPRSIDPRSTV